jgi:hypothetical protein
VVSSFSEARPVYKALALRRVREFQSAHPGRHVE